MTIRPPKEKYLIVDGYNIIFAWEHLAETANQDLDAARRHLCDILSSYAGFTKCHTVVVFDSYRTPGSEKLRTQGIQVVYTQQSLFGMVQNVRPCPDCNGTGKIIKDKCPNCYGTGYTASKKKIAVTIPAGIDNGQMLRDRGNGEPGTNGGPRGDLLVEVVVSQHPVFKRQDTTIYSTVPISFVKAALGGPIHIKTVDGEVEYEVKPGTQTDTRVRLKGKGVPSLRNRNVRGDHFVTLVVQVPERMTEAQKEALRKFDDAMNGIAPEGEKHRKKGLFGKLEK